MTFKIIISYMPEAFDDLKLSFYHIYNLQNNPNCRELISAIILNVKSYDNSQNQRPISI